MRRILLLLLVVQDQTQSEELPRIRTLSGTVSVWRADANKIETVEKTARVAPKDRIGTAGGEVAKFATEGSLTVLLKGVKVGADKGMALERKGGKIVLRIFRGTVVVESYESEIEVVTDQGKVAGKEVHFLVTADESSTKVITFAGTPTFTNDLGTVTVGEGQTSEADKGKAPSKPRTAGAGELEAARAMESDSNLVKNAGFEDGLDGWSSDFPVIKEERQLVRTGRKSCRCPIKVEGQSEPVLPTRTLKGILKPYSRYLLRFYVQTESYARDGKPAGLKLGIDRSGRGEWSDTKYHFEFAASEGEWSVRRFSFEATGADVSIAIFTATDRGRYSGTVCFDDFYLGEFPALKGK